jgi:TonB family protein
MKPWHAVAVVLFVCACGKHASGARGGGDSTRADAAPALTPDQEAPVAVNGDAPIQYPPRLYDRHVEGDVVLRLFVDSTGRLVPESSRVAESSGYPVLDSAALTGAAKLRFAPARRHGIPIAAPFLQPVEFRHPRREARPSAAAVSADTTTAATHDTTTPKTDAVTP